MKKIFLFGVFLSMYVLVTAQAVVGKSTYQKAPVDALIDQFPFAEKTVVAGIKESMDKKGIKGKSGKDFTVYELGTASPLGTEEYKIYLMVETKSKKEKDASVVTMLLSKGFDSMLTTTTDATTFENAKAYLATLKEDVAAYDLNQKIKEQEDVVKKTDKKEKNLQSSLEDLQKKKTKIEKDLENASKELTDSQAETQKQQALLEALKQQRKS